MKKYRLKISRQDFEELHRLVLADLPDEAGAFALAGIANVGDQVDILVRRPIAVPKRMMLVQNEYHLEMAPQAINGLVALCEANQLGAVICHSHLDGLRYSPSDDYGEYRIANTLRQFIPQKAPIASLLFTPDKVTGRIWLPGNSQPTSLDEIIVVGHYVHKIELRNVGRRPAKLDLYDRQVRTFGESGQVAISHAKVGIIGVGGTGSPVAEQLTRLGVSDFVLIDPDKFSPTNLSRVYGTYYRSAKKSKSFSEYKVNLIASNLKKINPDAQIRAVSKNVVLTKVASCLLDRDILFLCTDEHWGRSIVNQIVYQYLIPAINLGVRITSEGGVISHAVGAVDVLRPDKPCLWCKQFLRSERIAAESLPLEERRKLLQEGYVEDVDSKTPAVISFTSSVASSAVSQFIHLFTNFMGDAGEISRLNYDFLTGLSSRGTTNIESKCICQKVRGVGDLVPLPTLTRLAN
ncbi:MAG: ThiF family adenylyltransferase [Anaerolineales bacterium]|nr:ThiF family adenylyltransferase [Anaerolineales bacterium]